MTIWRIHHGIQKQTAIEDYNAVRDVCIKTGHHPIEPKGKSWQKIEDATAAMVKVFTVADKQLLPYLNRGVDYYYSI